MIEALKDSIFKLSERLKSQRELISTEEATKNAFIMPFIQTMGYDVFDPSQVVPEFVTDIGIKRGERVDYAILRDGKAEILIECKSVNTALDVSKESQLFRYFTASEAQFAILTNGIEYKFYTDLDAPNKMDEKPFLEFSLLFPDKVNFQELSKLTNEKFDAISIRKSADHLKRVTAVRNAIKSEINDPSDDFIKFVFKKVSAPGAMFNDKARNVFSPIVKAIIADTINDMVKKHLSTAVGVTEDRSEKLSIETAPQDNGIVTTQDELDGFAIVKAILHNKIPLNKITMADWKSYCSINYDGNSWKPIVRLYFNNPKNYRISVFDGKTEEKISISSVDDMFKHSEKIILSALKYLK